jgi:hypothetical protein
MFAASLAWMLVIRNAAVTTASRNKKLCAPVARRGPERSAPGADVYPQNASVADKNPDADTILTTGELTRPIYLKVEPLSR